MTEICVTHLVRQANDRSAFQVFLDSYKRNPGGVPHELLIVFKGFPGDASGLSAYDEMLSGVSHHRLFVDDGGYDIGPYLAAARRHQHRYFAFFNSFSEILHAGWLETMYERIREKPAGVVGATASWQSFTSDFIVLERTRPRPTLPDYKRLVLRLQRWSEYLKTYALRYPRFPNAHVRSNAFVIERELLLRLRCREIHNKWDAYRFESGADSLTRKVIAAGLTPFVVGRDQLAYAPGDWADSCTFRMGAQENLLVADNQTNDYAEADALGRERLSYYSWRRWPDGRTRADPPPLW